MYAINTSFNLSDNTWASSVGGPGLNLGEQIAGRSRLGTIVIESRQGVNRTKDKKINKKHTQEPLVGSIEVRFCNLSFDAAYDGGTSQTYERRAICGAY
jgi:hypothetical protein